MLLAVLQTSVPPTKENGGAKADPFFDISLLRLKSDEKTPPRNSMWPQLPAAISSMTNAFAVANFAVRLNEVESQLCCPRNPLVQIGLFSFVHTG